MRYFIISFLLLFSFSSIAFGQIVNVLASAEDRENGFWGEFSLPIEWQTGNTNLTKIGFELDSVWLHQNRLVLLLIDENYGSRENERYLSKGFEHLRYRQTLSELLAVESFVQHGFNEFQRIKMRALLGAGMRFTLSQWETGNLVYGTAYMFEYEIVDSGDSEDAGDHLRSSRWSNYLQFAHTIKENLTFSETVFFQPVITNPDDFRLLNQTAFRVASEGIFMELSLQLTYDTRVPEDVYSTQTILKSSLGYAF